MQQLTDIFLSRHTLYTEFDYDFEMISIISSQRDYRICWLINRALNIDLCRNTDLLISNSRKKTESLHNLYFYEDEINLLRFYLVTNKSSGIYLIPELKQADYFMLLKGDAAATLVDETAHLLENSPGIEKIFKSEPLTLRSKENLIFDLHYS